MRQATQFTGPAQVEELRDAVILFGGVSCTLHRVVQVATKDATATRMTAEIRDLKAEVCAERRVVVVG